jgi:FixJ family two-component response regulator
LETVLVVDDEPEIREIVTAILEEEGFAVLTAKDGDEALRLSHAYAGEIDILVTDVKMPEMSGIDLASHLQMDRSDMAVLFISGSCTGIQIDASKRPQFLAKPFDVTALLEAVRSAITKACSPSLTR